MRRDLLVVNVLLVSTISAFTQAQRQADAEPQFETLIHEKATYACVYLHSVGMRLADQQWESVDWA